MPTAPPRRLREAEPRQEGAEIEQTRQHVLALDNPGNGLHVQGMDGEHRGDQPPAGDGQTRGQAPQQQDVGRVQEDVDGVIAGRGEPPQLVLQPEARIDQRPVVPLVPDLRRPEPEAPEAVPVPDREGLVEDPVVPDEPGEEGGDVAADRQQGEGQGGEGLAPREPAFGSGNGRDRRPRPGGPLRRPAGPPPSLAAAHRHHPSPRPGPDHVTGIARQANAHGGSSPAPDLRARGRAGFRARRPQGSSARRKRDSAESRMVRADSSPGASSSARSRLRTASPYRSRPNSA